jgi:SpoU rRNA methylase family enzyme
MAMAGNTFSTLLREVWTPELQTTVFFNNWAFGGTFPILTPPGGSTISTGYEYAVTSNVGTYNFDDPMVEPFTSSQIRAYFNKDPFQEAARVFGVYEDWHKNGGTETENFESLRHSLEIGTKNLIDKATTTMIADLEAQIDSSTAYSDASLSRTTYATLKSYEEATSTALTLAHLEDAIEALMTHITYGQTIRSQDDLLILLPRNQLTNLSRLTQGASNFILSTDTQNGAAADAGRVFRTTRFEGIEIMVVPDMTTTVLLIVNKPDIKIYEQRPVTWKEKTEAADTTLLQGTGGWNMIAHNPGNHAKLSGKTA